MVNPPLPSWAQDTAELRAWIRQERDVPPPRTIVLDIPRRDDEQDIARMTQIWEQRHKETVGGVVAWDDEQEQSVAFGWAGMRLRVFRNPQNKVKIDISQWRSDGWNTASSQVYQTVLELLSEISRGRLSINNTKSFHKEFDLIDPWKTPLVAAPWEQEKMRSAAGVVYFPSHQDGDLLGVDAQNWGAEPDHVGVLRWLGGRLRRIGVRFPELRFIWAGLGHKKKEQLLGDIPRALASLHEDPQWMKRPWLWIWSCAQNTQNLGTITVDQMERMIHKRVDIIDLPFLAEPWLAAQNAMGITSMDGNTRQWCEQLPLSHVRRLRKACWGGWANNKSHPALVAELLATQGQGVRAGPRIQWLLSTPYVLWAWLSTQTAWRTSNKLWFASSYPIEEPDNDEMKWKASLQRARNIHDQSPVGFELMARATRAWISAVGTPNNTADRSVMDRLALVAHGVPDTYKDMGQDWRWPEFVANVDRVERLVWAKQLTQNSALLDDTGKMLPVFQGFTPERAAQWLLAEPEWQTWQDPQGNNLLDGACRAAHGLGPGMPRPASSSECRWKNHTGNHSHG